MYPSSSCGLTMAESSRLTPWICMVWSPSACHHFKNWMLPCWNSREKISHFPPLTVTVDLSFGKCNSGRKMRVGAPEAVGESAVKDRVKVQFWRSKPCFVIRPWTASGPGRTNASIARKPRCSPPSFSWGFVVIEAAGRAAFKLLGSTRIACESALLCENDGEEGSNVVIPESRDFAIGSSKSSGE